MPQFLFVIITSNLWETEKSQSQSIEEKNPLTTMYVLLHSFLMVLRSNASSWFPCFYSSSSLYYHKKPTPCEKLIHLRMHQHVKIKRCLSSVVNLWSYSACIRQKSYLISGAYLSKRSTLGRGLALNAWHTDRLWRHQVSGQCLSPSHIYHTRMALEGVCPCVCSI